MKDNWEKSYAVVRVYEGGNVNNPKDPGGRTSRGITQRVYDGYRHDKGLKNQNVYKATDAEVEEIYLRQYWIPAKCDALPTGVDLTVFDIAVNSGISRAYKILQASLNARGAKLRVDGTAGMVTVAAAQNDTNDDELIAEMGRRRLAFYKGLSTYSTFGDGWKTRNRNCVSVAQSWASGAEKPYETISPPNGGEAKAHDEDIKTSPVAPSTGTAISATSAAGAGGVEAVQNQIDTANSALQPLTQYLDYVQYACTALVLAGVAITFYALFKNYKAGKVHAAEV